MPSPATSQDEIGYVHRIQDTILVYSGIDKFRRGGGTYTTLAMMGDGVLRKKKEAS